VKVLVLELVVVNSPPGREVGLVNGGSDTDTGVDSATGHTVV